MGSCCNWQLPLGAQTRQGTPSYGAAVGGQHPCTAIMPAIELRHRTDISLEISLRSVILMAAWTLPHCPDAGMQYPSGVQRGPL